MNPALASFLWGVAGALVVNLVSGVGLVFLLLSHDPESPE